MEVRLIIASAFEDKCVLAWISGDRATNRLKASQMMLQCLLKRQSATANSCQLVSVNKRIC